MYAHSEEDMEAIRFNKGKGKGAASADIRVSPTRIPVPHAPPFPTLTKASSPRPY